MRELINKVLQGEQSAVDLALDEVSMETRNSTNSDGVTLLMAAASIGHEELLTVLLDLVCDWCMKDNNGRTALDYALSSRDYMCIKLLKSCYPKRTADGNYIYDLDNCVHPTKYLLVDFKESWLCCTYCSVILETDLNQKDMEETVAEFGIDNDRARILGLKRSLETRRKKTIDWLERRKRARRGGREVESYLETIEDRLDLNCMEDALSETEYSETELMEC